jgi:hypothetical protein
MLVYYIFVFDLALDTRDGRMRIVNLEVWRESAPVEVALE